MRISTDSSGILSLMPENAQKRICRIRVSQLSYLQRSSRFCDRIQFFFLSYCILEICVRVIMRMSHRLSTDNFIMLLENYVLKVLAAFFCSSKQKRPFSPNSQNLLSVFIKLLMLKKGTAGLNSIFFKL